MSKYEDFNFLLKTVLLIFFIYLFIYSYTQCKDTSNFEQPCILLNTR